MCFQSYGAVVGAGVGCGELTKKKKKQFEQKVYLLSNFVYGCGVGKGVGIGVGEGVLKHLYGIYNQTNQKVIFTVLVQSSR